MMSCRIETHSLTVGINTFRVSKDVQVLSMSGTFDDRGLAILKLITLEPSGLEPNEREALTIRVEVVSGFDEFVPSGRYLGSVCFQFYDYHAFLKDS